MNEVPNYDFRWQQGDDGEISFIYKYGKPPVALDISSWTARMDINSEGVGSVYSIASSSLTNQPGSGVTLGADGRVDILISRHATLPGGALSAMIGQVLTFDIFLRNPQNKQKKILMGTIYVEPSNTLWN